MEQRGVFVGSRGGRGESACLDHCCREQQAEAPQAGISQATWLSGKESEDQVDRPTQDPGGE